MSKTASRGRPPASSRDMLQEAAFELFLENSYAGTSIEQITQRAGVSRNTFFNYFSAKSDVFWVDLDATIGQLTQALKDSAAHTPVMPAIRDAIVGLGAEFGPNRVPFALTQYELIGSVHELQASALVRFTRQAKTLHEFIVRRLPKVDVTLARAAAYAALGATVAAAQEWSAAGTGRGPLESYLRTALAPVVDGFQGALAPGQ
ncbi:TetR/AcrR family transcriptional regulator [Parafrigoribacterium mesophilum]|uniref:TetR/AcrR family transcriptional regulator n=1 Tax=Parafrigoribacterium mesophilum TaxID=433646 RepID=UPI0031FD757A